MSQVLLGPWHLQVLGHLSVPTPASTPIGLAISHHSPQPPTGHWTPTDALGPVRFQKYVVCSGASCYTESKGSTTCIAACTQIMEQSLLSMYYLWLLFSSLCLLLGLHLKMSRQTGQKQNNKFRQLRFCFPFNLAFRFFH